MTEKDLPVQSLRRERERERERIRRDFEPTLTEKIVGSGPGWAGPRLIGPHKAVSIFCCYYILLKRLKNLKKN